MRPPLMFLGLTVLTAGLMSCSDEGPTVPVVRAERVTDDHREIDLDFASGDGVILSGTVYLPLGPGPFRALVMSPGSSWTLRSPWEEVAFAVSGLNTAVFSHDRRGDGESGGTCCPQDAAAHFALLADDAAAGAEALQSLERIDPAAVGVLGSSLGGWVVPLAASAALDDIAFVVISVGGAVSTGQEGLYDQLTGFDVCTPTGTPMDSIIQLLIEAGPSGFDPRESLEQLAQPTLWLFGGNDLSHPTRLAVLNLDEIQSRNPKDWTIQVFPTANHGLIAGGSICQETGPLADVLPTMAAWLARFGG